MGGTFGRHGCYGIQDSVRIIAGVPRGDGRDLR